MQDQQARNRNFRGPPPAPAAAAAAAAAPANNTTSPIQRAFWQAITVGELDTIQVLLKFRKDIDVNRVDEFGEQRQGCTALQLAVLEMPTWKVEGGRGGAADAAAAVAMRNNNGIQSADFVKRFFSALLDNGADINKPCLYTGEWYLQTAAGKTKSFYPEGYDALGLVLQFIEITRGAEVISANVTRRLELIRDLLLDYIKRQRRTSSAASRINSTAAQHNTLAQDLYQAYRLGIMKDVELISQGRTIAAHKLILASRSPVFAAMFRPGFAESTMNPCRVEIVGTEHIALEQFVQFMYEDCVADNLCFAQCHELLQLANRYQVGALKQMCSERIIQNHLTVENSAVILKLAVDNNCQDLRSAALRYMSKRDNLAMILNNADFQQLNASLMQEVLRSVANKMPSSLHSDDDDDSCGEEHEYFDPRLVTTSKRQRLRAVEDNTVHAPPNNAPTAAAAAAAQEDDM